MAQGSATVRIIGGGLTGVLAALAAHRLGWRRIELHERFGELGGGDLPRLDHGVELRARRRWFGPPGDPVRTLLEAHGLAFEDIAHRTGSVSPSPCGEFVAVRDVAGPVLPCRDPILRLQSGDSLADRLRTYPADVAQPLTRYCQWRLGAWLDEVHASAAVTLGVDQVRPIDQDQDHPAASLPAGGFAVMFAAARQAMARLGIDVRLDSFVAPREVLARHAPGDLLVWAAAPAPLYPLVGLEAPRQLGRSLAAYVFKARYGGPVPFHLRNFTAEGVVCDLHLYESRGQVLMAVRCVAETPDADLRREIHRLMAGFDGASLDLGEQVLAERGPCEAVPTVEAARKLKALRAGLAPGVIDGGHDLAGETERLARIEALLSATRLPAAANAA